MMRVVTVLVVVKIRLRIRVMVRSHLLIVFELEVDALGYGARSMITILLLFAVKVDVLSSDCHVGNYLAYSLLFAVLPISRIAAERQHKALP